MAKTIFLSAVGIALGVFLPVVLAAITDPDIKYGKAWGVIISLLVTIFVSGLLWLGELLPG
jgi:hypothetical protein